MFVLIVGVLVPFSNPAWAQTSDFVLTKVAEAQLDSLAARAAAKMKASNRGPVPPYVIVFDFQRESPKSSSLLGSLLADRFADMLRHSGIAIEVIDRERIKTYLKKNLTDTDDLASFSAYLSVAKDLGATDLIRGDFSEDENQMLNISIHNEGSFPPFEDETQFLISKDIEDLLVKPAPSNHIAPEAIPQEPGVVVIGPGPVEGMERPACITCADPKYTEVGRMARFSGTVIMSALVTADGQVTAVYIMRGVPFGLTEQAIAAVKGWKLKPAMKDGKAVPVRVEITTTFRLL
jgi:TonB family protein